MKISRLFEIVYIILDKKLITAKELAEHFEVSQRTIYRDIDTLAEAGIPVFTNKGKGGGILLSEGYVLNKSILSEAEQNEILSSLEGLQALQNLELKPVLKKMGTFFQRESTNWIEVDFSGWGSAEDERMLFSQLKGAVLNKKAASFLYYSSKGEMTERCAEPLKLVFKSQNWYLYGFCRVKKEERFFKVSRMKKLVILEESFTRSVRDRVPEKKFWNYQNSGLKIKLHIDKCMAFRVYDEFLWDDITRLENGDFRVNTRLPEGEWIFGYVMSFGGCAVILKPEHLRDELIVRLEKARDRYGLSDD